MYPISISLVLWLVPEGLCGVGMKLETGLCDDALKKGTNFEYLQGGG